VKLPTRSHGHDRHSPVPSVNLLSPWVFEAIATRRLRKRFTVAAAVLVLAVGAGWGVQHLRTGQAQQVLSVEQAETTRLTAQTNELAPVRTYVATVGQQKVLVQGAMGNEVLLSRVLTGLHNDTPAGARVETTGITLAPPPPATDAQPAAVAAVSPCPGPDPFNTRVVIGCVTLSGTADSRATVGDFVVNLGHDKLFVEPFISATTTAEGTDVVFTGSVGLSEKAFSRRYVDIDAALAKEPGR
jgi:hypothetical protein